MDSDPHPLFSITKTADSDKQVNSTSGDTQTEDSTLATAINQKNISSCETLPHPEAEHPFHIYDIDKLPVYVSGSSNKRTRDNSAYSGMKGFHGSTGNMASCCVIHA